MAKTEKSSLNWLKHICIWIKREKKATLQSYGKYFSQKIIHLSHVHVVLYFFSTLLSFCGQIGCVPGIWWHHWRLLGRSFSFCCVCLNMIDCIKMVALKKNNPQPSRLLLAKCELCSFFFVLHWEQTTQSCSTKSTSSTQTTWTCLYSLYYLLVNFFRSPLKTQQLEEKPIPCYKLSLFLSLSVALLPLHMFDLWNPTSFHHMAHLWLPHSLYRPFVLTLSS